MAIKPVSIVLLVTACVMLCVFTGVEGGDPCRGRCVPKGKAASLPCCCEGLELFRIMPNAPSGFCVPKGSRNGDAKVEEDSASDESSSAGIRSFLQSITEEKW